jgi:hypothetical protein
MRRGQSGGKKQLAALKFISARGNGIPFALSSGKMGIFFPSATAFGQHELN